MRAGCLRDVGHARQDDSPVTSIISARQAASPKGRSAGRVGASRLWTAVPGQLIGEQREQAADLAFEHRRVGRRQPAPDAVKQRFIWRTMPIEQPHCRTPDASRQNQALSMLVCSSGPARRNRNYRKESADAGFGDRKRTASVSSCAAKAGSRDTRREEGGAFRDETPISRAFPRSSSSLHGMGNRLRRPRGRREKASISVASRPDCCAAGSGHSARLPSRDSVRAESPARDQCICAGSARPPHAEGICG